MENNSVSQDDESELQNSQATSPLNHQSVIIPVLDESLGRTSGLSSPVKALLQTPSVPVDPALLETALEENNPVVPLTTANLLEHETAEDIELENYVGQDTTDLLSGGSDSEGSLIDFVAADDDTDDEEYLPEPENSQEASSDEIEEEDDKGSQNQTPLDTSEHPPRKKRRHTRSSVDTGDLKLLLSEAMNFVDKGTYT